MLLPTTTTSSSATQTTPFACTFDPLLGNGVAVFCLVLPLDLTSTRINVSPPTANTWSVKPPPATTGPPETASSGSAARSASTIHPSPVPGSVVRPTNPSPD